MMTTPVQESDLFTEIEPLAEHQKWKRFRMRPAYYQQIALLLLTAVLLCSSYIFYNNQRDANAANPGPGNSCSWYIVRWGDTLSKIAWQNNTTYMKLAQVNYISNVNLIFVGQRLCIPYPTKGGGGNPSSGLLANGTVRWYAYNALDWSSRSNVAALIRKVAAYYGLPANLVLAIAWQESGWTQHVIAYDGGIGVMQLMPYTAQGINSGTGVRRDPYHLVDNIYLGITYLRWQWNSFHGDLNKVISAYNEGGSAVINRGIFNWHYVNNVRSLMSQF